MRGWFLLVALMLVAAVVALVLGISRTRDEVPEQLSKCIVDLDAAVVLGPDLLGPLRSDLTAQDGPELVEEFDIGGNAARLYAGTGYRLLVMEGRNGEPLDDTTPRQAFEDATRFSVVAIERDPVRDALAACARISG